MAGGGNKKPEKERMKKCCHKYWRRKAIFRSLSLWNMFSNFPRSQISSRARDFPENWCENWENRHYPWEIFSQIALNFAWMPAQHPIVHGDGGKNSVLSVFRNVSNDEDGILKSRPDLSRKKYFAQKRKTLQRRQKIMKIVKHKIWCRRIFFVAPEFPSYSWQPHQR